MRYAGRGKSPNGVIMKKKTIRLLSLLLDRSPIYVSKYLNEVKIKYSHRESSPGFLNKLKSLKSYKLKN